MKIRVAHLLHYCWSGPAIGFRIKASSHCAGIVFRIPQWLSDFLIHLKL